MILRGLHIIGLEEKHQNVRVGNDDHELFFENAIAFPGLINSHDHLDFDLFPQIGNKVYKNYIEWGADIQVQNRSEIDRILRIPADLRVQWGVYRNLLNGFTTAINHGKRLAIPDPLINIFQDVHSLHSVDREKFWKVKLNNPFIKDIPFVIHAGEGTDQLSSEEINLLIKKNRLKRKLVAVHGVAMTAEQAKSFKALIWCPASNFFLLNATAKIDQLKKNTNILFGTDSTLTAPWNAWEQLRQARQTGLANDSEIFEMITTNAIQTFNLDDNGMNDFNNVTDIVVASSKNEASKWDRFYSINPGDMLLIAQGGEIKLFDSSLLNHVQNDATFKPINIMGKTKYVKGDLRSIVQQIHKIDPGIRLPVE